MNYFRLHIGDYLRDASHLSLLEHGVYTRLLQVYYTRESTITDAEKYRIVSARSPEERQAVDDVLAEFFAQDDDGAWRQSRCDREIAEYQAKAERNREVGKLGGNPKKKRGYNEPGHLYAVQRVAGGPIKVGISKWPASRFSALRNQHGAIVVLGDAEVEDMGASEAFVHDAFAGRLDGEWIAAEWAEIAPVFAASAAVDTVPSGHPTGSRLGALASSQEPIANKEKEEKKEGAQKRTPISRGCQIPDGFPAEPEFAWCRGSRPELDPQRVGSVFRDFHLSRGSVMKDWSAAWRTWVGKERGVQARASPYQSAADTRDAKRAAFLHDLTGGLMGSAPHDERTIDADFLRIAAPGR